MALPTDPYERKTYPLDRGLFRYFPDALAAVSNRSYEGAKQYGQDKMFWDRSISTNHGDSMLRHFMDALEHDKVDDYAALAWRALALLQLRIEKQASYDVQTEKQSGCSIKFSER